MTAHSPFIGHHFAHEPIPDTTSTLYDYILAGNGLFLSAKRRELSALIPLADYPVAGLPSLKTHFTLTIPRVPQQLIEHMLEEAQRACADPAGPLESLFHFEYDDAWTLTSPEQIRTPVSVQPTDPEGCPSYARAIVEIHSHHKMTPHFSAIDDEDETGFRIYGVCGWLDTRPSITFRIGIYGHFMPIPAAFIAELPSMLQDAYTL